MGRKRDRLGHSSLIRSIRSRASAARSGNRQPPAAASTTALIPTSPPPSTAIIAATIIDRDIAAAISLGAPMAP
jgi:hypothetical protein